MDIARTFSCIICKKIPIKAPWFAHCCESFYCNECLTGWTEKTKMCFNHFYGICNKKIDANEIRGFKFDIWKKLDPQCSFCKRNINIGSIHFHEYICSRPKRGKKPNQPNEADWSNLIKSLSGPNYSRNLKKKMSSVRNVIGDLQKTEKVHSELMIALLAAKTYCKETRKKSIEKVINHLIQSINANDEVYAAFNKLTPLQTAALR